eukprot:CAMPEP_0115009516 /NCGR_PEP_ID=MMETSP0216-20121206/22674_1 /TAXON_ID=223996 /ORGANISM="Protocruzia adherens, Strain Boccale" /LENGTH=443 /DNA_ID=CAMNT_0002377369 /DNA_START=301 /DNA_END=1632 /DNA_ORIENTATION=+
MSRKITFLTVSLVCLCLFGLLLQTEAKYKKGNIKFDKQKATFIDKFAYMVGTGTYKIRYKFDRAIDPTDLRDRNQNDGSGNKRKNLNVQIATFLDEHWEDVEAIGDYCKAVDEGLHKQNNNISVPMDGTWSEYFEESLNQYVRSHVWLFLAHDCEAASGGLLRAGRLPKVKYEIFWTNSDGSQFSYEESSLVTVYFLLLLFFSILTTNNFYQLFLMYKKEETYDNVLIFLNVAVITEFIAILFDLIHMAVYANNGQGVQVLNIFGSIFSLISQFILTLILILIASGWTITYNELQNIDAIIPISMLVAFSQIVFYVIGSVHQREYRYHDFEGWHGVVIAIIKIAIFAYFVYCVVETLQQNASQAKTVFLRKFSGVCTLYLLSFPLMLMMAPVWAPYLRHKFLVTGTYLAQTLTMVVMTRLLTSKGDYYKASFKSHGILPSKLD